MKKIIISITITIIVITLSSNIIEAFGVSTEYYNNNPLKIERGQVREITIKLQNMVGDQDYMAEVRVAEGGEIARINGSGEYNVPIGTQELPVKIIINAPEKAKIGEKYQVRIEVIAKPKVSTGEVSINQGTGAIVPVEIIGEEKNYLLIILIVFGIILALMIYLIRRKSLKRGGFYNY